MKILNEKTVRALWVFLSALSLALAPVAAAVQPHIFFNGGLYFPDIDDSVACGANGCVRFEEGIAFSGGVGFSPDDFEYVAAEFGGLYAFGDIDGSGSIPDGDWSTLSWLAGLRLQNSTDELEDTQYYARVGAAFYDREIDIGNVGDTDDGTDLYLGLGVRYKGIISGSLYHQDGDIMWSFGIDVPFRHNP